MMKLDRNDPDNFGSGKYALLLLRELDGYRSGTFGRLPSDIQAALDLLVERKIIDLGLVGSEGEFFVIRLKDKYAADGLAGYAAAARREDPEWAGEVAELASRASLNNPWCKRPD